MYHTLTTFIWPETGFHLTRKELDNLPNPKEAHQRRGADWTFDADQFVAAVREIRNKGMASITTETPKMLYACICSNPAVAATLSIRWHCRVQVLGAILLLTMR